MGSWAGVGLSAGALLLVLAGSWWFQNQESTMGLTVYQPPQVKPLSNRVKWEWALGQETSKQRERMSQAEQAIAFLKKQPGASGIHFVLLTASGELPPAGSMGLRWRARDRNWSLVEATKVDGGGGL